MDSRKMRVLSLVLMLLSLILGLSGCGERTSVHPAIRRSAASPVERSPKPPGSPVSFKGFTFVQDGLHNCGTVAMLISWANAHPQQAASLVWKQPDGSYLVSFKGGGLISVTTDDLAAAEESKLVRSRQGDYWGKIVLTAFAKAKCGSGPLDFRATDWIYPGEIGSLLTGGQMEDFQIKQESVDANARIRVGPPVSSSVLKRALNDMKGKPAVAYTNRRIHIWAVMDYDPGRSRILIRNPRRQASEWLSVAEFGRKFQVVVYVE